MKKTNKFYHKTIETMDPDRLRSLQEEKFKKQIR
jgi:hypothetical protein